MRHPRRLCPGPHALQGADGFSGLCHRLPDVRPGGAAHRYLQGHADFGPDGQHTGPGLHQRGLQPGLYHLAAAGHVPGHFLGNGAGGHH